MSIEAVFSDLEAEAFLAGLVPRLIDLEKDWAEVRRLRRWVTYCCCSSGVMSCIGFPRSAWRGTFAKSVVGLDGGGDVGAGDDEVEEAGLVGFVVEGEVMGTDEVGCAFECVGEKEGVEITVWDDCHEKTLVCRVDVGLQLVHVGGLEVRVWGGRKVHG